MIQQLVVLAGGKGTRIQSCHPNKPKILVEFGGQTLLQILLRQFVNYDYREIFLMTGYKSNLLKKEVENLPFTLRKIVKVIKSDNSFDPLRRIKIIESDLDSMFTVVYSDNFVQFDLNKSVEQFLNYGKNSVGQLTLGRKINQGNIHYNDSTKKIRFEENPSNLTNNKEIGYSHFNSKEFFFEAKRFKSLSNMFRQLANESKLIGFNLDHDYASIGDCSRIMHTQSKFMKIYGKTLLLDRDGVINKKRPQGKYVDSIDDLKLKWGFLLLVAFIIGFNTRLIVLSNQPGIARKKLNLTTLKVISVRIRHKLRLIGFKSISFYYCLHNWNDGCECRKPSPGLFFQMANFDSLILNQYFFVGDDPRDAFAAIRAGINWILINDDISSEIEIELQKMSTNRQLMFKVVPDTFLGYICALKFIRRSGLY